MKSTQEKTEDEPTMYLKTVDASGVFEVGSLVRHVYFTDSVGVVVKMIDYKHARVFWTKKQIDQLDSMQGMQRDLWAMHGIKV